MKVVIYLVEYQNQYEDLPPYIWFADKAFLIKSEAISYAISRDFRKEERSYRISRQIDMSDLQIIYYIRDGKCVKA